MGNPRLSHLRVEVKTIWDVGRTGESEGRHFRTRGLPMVNLIGHTSPSSCLSCTPDVCPGSFNDDWKSLNGFWLPPSGYHESSFQLLHKRDKTAI